MSFFQRISFNLSGGICAGDWVSMTIFYILSAIACMSLDFLNRDKESKNTPVVASWAFWWRNNKGRIFIMPLIAFLLLRFIAAWFPIFSQSLGLMELATGLGLIGDGIFIVIREVQWWYKQKFIKTVRE